MAGDPSNGASDDDDDEQIEAEPASPHGSSPLDRSPVFSERLHVGTTAAGATVGTTAAVADGTLQAPLLPDGPRDEGGPSGDHGGSAPFGMPPLEARCDGSTSSSAAATTTSEQHEMRSSVRHHPSMSLPHQSVERVVVVENDDGTRATIGLSTSGSHQHEPWPPTLTHPHPYPSDPPFPMVTWQVGATCITQHHTHGWRARCDAPFARVASRASSTSSS